MKTYEEIKIGDKAADGHQLRPNIVWFEEPVYMIESAIPIIQNADIIVIVGTSLVVYPAAGLLYYAKDEIPKFILDKKIPVTSSLNNIVAIEKPASEATLILEELLKEYY